MAIRRVLIVNKTLTDLNISNCNIDWINAKILSEGLAKNQTLKTLNVREKRRQRRANEIDSFRFCFSWRLIR